MCPLLTARRMKQHEKGQTYFWYLDRLQLFRLSSSRLNSYESKTWPMLSALEPLWEMTVEDGGVMSTHVSALTSQTISTEGIYRRKHSLATTVTWRSCDATGPTTKISSLWSRNRTNTSLRGRGIKEDVWCYFYAFFTQRFNSSILNDWCRCLSL